MHNEALSVAAVSVNDPDCSPREKEMLTRCSALSGDYGYVNEFL
jgi:hypothetical protein